ncbi:MAG: PspC domain-containing protein [Phycisphaerae bacterium]|nr:PspC domain-containing protein [Phycisphaerae bacterium]
MTNLSKPLRRSRRHRMIAGVCGGVAEYFEVDPTLVRAIYLTVSVFSVAVPGTLLYLLLWIVIPSPED